MRTLTIHLPLSAFRLPLSRRRRALTLAEVLIAMGLLAVGLLGVAAVFPVGGHYLQTGDIADRSGAIAQAALEDAVIRGYLDPNNWVVHDVDASGRGTFMPLVAGNVNVAVGANRLGLRARLASQSTDVMAATPDLPITARASSLGGAYVIDPIGLTAALADGPNITDPIATAPARRFPAFGGLPIDTAPEWDGWRASPFLWPVRRVTTIHTVALLNNGGIASRQQPLADGLFRTSDDLALSLPNSGDEPAKQLWEAWSAGSGPATASLRQARREYSWLLTVAPGSAAERDTFATQPDAHPVEVSAVVFHKRSVGRGALAATEEERLVNARVVSSGPGGGELLLEKRTGGSPVVDPDESPFVDLREGHYLMVVGPHPLSTVNDPRFALRWCRVLRVEDSGAPTLPDPDVNPVGSAPNLTLSREGANPRVIVALRGPDWPWLAATDPGSRVPDLQTDAGSGTELRLSNDLRVAIVPGVVAVHTKTMRLEAGSAWTIN